MPIRGRILDSTQRKSLNGTGGGRHHTIGHLRFVEAFGLQVVHEIIRVERWLMAARALPFAEKNFLPHAVPRPWLLRDRACEIHLALKRRNKPAVPRILPSRVPDYPIQNIDSFLL